ncbi:MAG: hypothetical protein HKM95_15295 [Inquilinus sp.]|nr:hypothetical protein [Inquilinus sp.]
MCRIGGLLALALLAACTQKAGRDATLFRMAAVSDEPQATMAGREVLLQGGTAADAAVAMAMTMSVTLPSRVGLGGGGACLVHDPETGTVRALDFLPRAPGGPGGAAQPLLLRGLAALHAEYGAVRWEAAMVKAENAARFGVPVSRALARDVEAAAAAGRPLALTGPAGLPLREGEQLEQPALAGLLSEIRIGGAGAFYNGSLGRDYAEAASAAGWPLTAQSVREARPRWIEPATTRFGRDVLSFLPDPVAPGGALRGAWLAAENTLDDRDLAVDERLVRLAAAQRAGGPALAADGAATLVALSNDGMAVACGLTINGAFGTGQRLPANGVFVAPAPGPDALLGGVAMLVNQPKSQFLFGGAADSPAALLVPMTEVLLREEALTAAMEAARGGVDPADGAVIVETAAGPAAIDRLTRDGYAVRTAPSLGRASAIFCLWDRASSSFCSAVADPRGSGLAFIVEG